RVLEMDPRHTGALNNLGLIYLKGAREGGAGAGDRQGRASRALAYFDQALDVDPGLAAAHYNRGLALLLLSRRLEARSAFERAAALTAGGDPDAARLRPLLERAREVR